MDVAHSSSSSSSSSSHPSTASKRKAGRRKFKETRHPIYCGVRERNGGKWVCEMREPHKKSRIWLGTYATPEMAARAHDVAAIALRGCSVPLNFPDSAWAMPQPQSLSSVDIRRAAAEAANMSAVPQRAAPLPEAVFVDEEAIFNMPGLLEEMATGLLVTPPGMQLGFDWNGVEFDMDLSLWDD